MGSQLTLTLESIRSNGAATPFTWNSPRSSSRAAMLTPSP
jgi:hypothetical protein